MGFMGFMGFIGLGFIGFIGFMGFRVQGAAGLWAGASANTERARPLVAGLSSARGQSNRFRV